MLLKIPAIAYPDLSPDGEVVSMPGNTETPYGALNRAGYRTMTTNSINSTLGVEHDLDFITKGLSARAIVSYDTWAGHSRGFRRSYLTLNQNLDTSGDVPVVDYSQGSGADSELTKLLEQNFRTNYDVEASLNYNRTFYKHDLTGLLLYKQSEQIINIEVPYNYVGIVGRATYGYDRKYLAEFNFGLNGSEQFAPGRRFGFFPSLSLGWVLSEESFMKSIKAIDFLKLRASFGQVGNDKISGLRFIYLSDWDQGSSEWASMSGSMPGLPLPVYQKNMENEFVSWEVSNKANLGFEMQFFNGFEFDADLFYEKRNSILITESAIPKYIFGQLNLPPVNDGVMTNHGFEANIGYHKAINKDLFIKTRFSAAFARNKIINSNESPLDDTYAYPYRTEGFSRGTQWGYDCLGYFESMEEINSSPDQTGLSPNILPGDLKFRDVNNDGFINAKDLIPMNHPIVPELNFSFSFMAQYKGFDLSVLLNMVTNYSYPTDQMGILDWEGDDRFSPGLKNYFEHHKYAWTEERFASGDKILYPRLHPDGVSVSKVNSNYWIKDLWYLRLKNIELGYSLPKRVTSNLGLENVRFYFNGLNLLTFDNMLFKVLDPEVVSSPRHPTSNLYNFGLNVTF